MHFFCAEITGIFIYLFLFIIMPILHILLEMSQAVENSVRIYLLGTLYGAELDCRFRLLTINSLGTSEIAVRCTATVQRFLNVYKLNVSSSLCQLKVTTHWP